MISPVDLLIVGGGSAGFSAAGVALRLGKAVKIVEGSQLGGTCINRGCIPSKRLIELAKTYHARRHSPLAAGHPRDVMLDFPRIVREKDNLLRLRRERYERRAAEHRHVVTGPARFVDAHTVAVNGWLVRGDKILVAAGAEPVIPEIDGLREVPYLTSDLLAEAEAGELAELPESLLIVGGGYIALELGQMFQRFGTRVTVVERSAALLTHGYEPEVGEHLRAVLEEEGIRFRFSSEVRSARAEGGDAILTLSTGEEVRAAKLLVATGRRPATRGLALERAGVTLGAHGEIAVDPYMRTNVPHVFAAGDVVGRQQGSQMATPVANEEARIAAHNALVGEPLRSVDHRIVPRVIFTDPEVATVGSTEAELLAAGRRCSTNVVPMARVARASLTGRPLGFAQMVVDEDTREVLGVTVVGPGGGEVIHEAAMGMRFRAKASDFAELLHVFPSIAESLKMVAEGLSTRRN